MRNSAIELYRIILMFLIVLGHASGQGYWNANRLDVEHPSLYIMFTMLIIWHVDGFLSITGWFGTRFSVSRFLRLWGIITAYSIPSILFGWFAYGHHVGHYMAGGWFGCTYLYFLFLTPVLNVAVEGLAKCGKKAMYTAWILLDVAVVMSSMPYQLVRLSHIEPRGIDHYSIMTFLIVYINVRLLRLSGLCDRMTKRHLLCACALFCVGVVLNILISIPDSGYGSPQVILMAVAGLVFFMKYVRVPLWLEKPIAVVSPLTFGIYILHNTTSFGRLIYLLPQEWLVKTWGGGGHPAVIVLITAVFCFVICAVVDYIRRICVTPISRWIMPYVKRIDQHLCLS